MREIPLTKDKVALVDSEDFEELNQYKWHATTSEGKWYARRNVKKESRRRTVEYMHTVIMGKKGVKHINGNGLDNRRENLSLE